ncbi:MAG TPA: carbon-nitrogen hydrolase family protein [Isosphaeraceae bacterium]|nr:carbon-nitrogen hydrolase family protein [Isosphaeraceae bacterium]
MTIRRRPIRVATVSHRPTAGADGPEATDRFLKAAETFIERGSRMGADLIAFPEHYPQIAVSDIAHHAEPHEGGTLDRVREAAKKHRLYIVWPRIEYDPARGLRNTSILVDRGGDVVGRYDKIFPTVGEIEKGIIPGTEAPCFETDFGRVGLMICFDMNFAEAHASLARGKPDLVVFSSMYRGGLQAQALAYELGAFVVSAIASELGQILDRCGRVLKESTYEALAVAAINTNSVALHMDFNWEKMDAMLAKYGPDLTFDYHTREAFYVIEDASERDISELVREFGLESVEAYYARSRRDRSEAIARFAKAKDRIEGR